MESYLNTAGFVFKDKKLTPDEVWCYTRCANLNHDKYAKNPHYLNQFTLIIYSLFSLDKIYEGRLTRRQGNCTQYEF